MNDPIIGNNFNDIYKELIRAVLQGNQVSPRGQLTYELTPGIFELTDIRKSLLTLEARKLAYKFNAAEKLCYITGNSGEDILPKYAPNIAKFINPETKKFDGSYGPRLIKQYQYVLDLLKRDPDTRQALLTVNNFHDDLHESLDIPCTLSLQFLIRNNKLNLIVNMRSNDLLWGTPYDVSQFTFIQECFACLLGIEPGSYIHNAGSMHIYQRDEETFKKILESNDTNIKIQLPVDIKSWEQLQDQSINVLQGNNSNNSVDFDNILTPYFNNLYKTLWE